MSITAGKPDYQFIADQNARTAFEQLLNIITALESEITSLEERIAALETNSE